MIIKSFRRQVSKSLIEQLKSDPLFVEHLLPDITNSKRKERVFPAIRNGRVDFYYAGGKLFSYREGKGFSTHVKYAAVLTGVAGDYITEGELKDACVIRDFRSGYQSIKANCARYAGIEAAGVADLCARSWFTVASDPILALDTEVSFSRDKAWGSSGGTEPANKKKGKKGFTDRPDLLLYDTSDNTLRFYEAKHFSNSELWAVHGAKPPVEEQLRRYNQILGDPSAQKSILAAYRKYIDCANNLFGLHLLPPERVETTAVLYIFGYDSKQARKIKDLLVEDGSLARHRLRCRGNTGDAEHTARTLWKNVRTCGEARE
jgi:hypothetical protein